jgi:hypothetical protein
MGDAINHTFEVKATADGRFAVLVDGVHIALHMLKADALAHCGRLRQAAEE